MEKVCAVILHENTLLAIGIQKILSDLFNIKSVYYNALTADVCIDDYDLFFVSMDCYARNADTFASRKHKTLLVSSVATDESADNSGDGFISQYWNVEKTVDVISRKISRLNDLRNSQGDLSKREIDVLKLVVSGLLNKEIADTLNISINTVLTHRKNITSKLGIKSVSGLSVYAMMNGYISPR